MAVTGTGSIAAEVKPLYPNHKPKRKPQSGGKPLKGVNAKVVKGNSGGKK